MRRRCVSWSRRGRGRSRVQRWRDIYAHIKPQPHGPHAHFPSGQQTELVHISAKQAHAILRRGLGKNCKIMQGVCKNFWQWESVQLWVRKVGDDRFIFIFNGSYFLLCCRNDVWFTSKISRWNAAFGPKKDILTFQSIQWHIQRALHI